MKNKECTKCKTYLPLNEEHFPKRKNSKDGFRNECKSCKNKYLKKYYIANKEDIRIQQKEKYMNDFEFRKSLNTRNRDYHTKNSKEIYAKRKDYLSKWSSDNLDKRAEYSREYKKRNKGKVNSSNARRKASKLNATPSWANIEKIKIVYEKAKWLESITGLKYHVDHIIPLNSNKVCGLHVWENLQILEASENIKKSNSL